jgi:hypothetical protein
MESYTDTHRDLTRVLTTGQERRNKPESSAAKLYCLHLQEPESKRAREQESKRARERKKKNKKARERKSKNKREKKQEQEREKARTRERKQEQEKEQEQESKRKNGKTPSLLRRIILRLGRITP